MDRTPIAKLLPPSQPVGFIARPALAGLITSVLSRRLTVVVAEAGFGKSTLMSGRRGAVAAPMRTEAAISQP